MDQAVLLGDRRVVASVAEILEEIVPQVIAAFPIDSGIRLKDVLMKDLDDWERVTGSEEFADDWSGAWDAFESGFEPSLDAAFRDMLQLSGTFKRGLRVAFEGEFEASGELKYAFLLGECVDQGIRPPGVKDHVHRRETNPERWIWRRFPAHRRALKEYRRDRALLLLGDSRRLSLGRAQIRLKRPYLPEKEVSALHVCPAGSIRPPIGWAETVRALWSRLQLSADLPKSLPAITRRPGSPGIFRVIDLIDQAAKVGFVGRRGPSTTLQYPHPDRTLGAGHSAAGGGQGTPPATTSGSFTAVGGSGGGLDNSKEVGSLGADQESLVGRDAHHTSREDHALGPQPAERAANKRRRISKADAESMVQHIIKKFINPTIKDISRATGLAQSSIFGTEAWKAHMTRRREKESKKAVNTRNLRKYSMDSFGADQDPSSQLEMREVLERYYLEGAGAGEVEDYNVSDDERKWQKLVEFAERAKSDAESFCRENPGTEAVRDYLESVNSGDIEVLLLFAQSIREMRSERVGRQRSQHEE